MLIGTLIASQWPYCPAAESESPSAHTAGDMFESLADAWWSGEHWCTNQDSQCYHSHRNRSYDIYLAWKDWIDPMAGGFPGLMLAGRIRTESEGNPFGKTKSHTQECGLASIDLRTSQDLDINACDPEANLWAALWQTNTRLVNLRKKFPALELASLEQQWLLSGAAGAIGSHRVIAMLKASKALEVNKAGELKHLEPYHWLGKWILHKDASGYDWATPAGKKLLGPWPAKSVFRYRRVWGAQVRLLGPMYLQGIPWGVPEVPARPEGILAFPGVKKHCACKQWPDLFTKRPEAHTFDPAIQDPRED